MKYLLCKEDSLNPHFSKGFRYAIKQETSKYYLATQDTGKDAKVYYNARNFNMYFEVIEIK